MKYLIWLALLGGVWWVLMARRKRDRPDSTPPREIPSEKMVVCAFCGVHLPQSEALVVNGESFCNEAHRVSHAGVER